MTPITPSDGAERTAAAKRPLIIPVTGGTFYCHHCGLRWVGTWRGDPALMTCRYCDAPMGDDSDA